MKIGVIGYTYWAQKLAQDLGQAGFDAEFLPWHPDSASPLIRRLPVVRKYHYYPAILTKRFKQLDVLHVVGRVNSPLFLKIVRKMKKKVVLHWVGTDVMLLYNRVARRGRSVVNFYHKNVDVHFTVCDHLAEELGHCGIEAQIYPLVVPGFIPETAPPLPETPRVLAYLPPARRKFYGGDIVDELAETFPETPFWIVGADGQGEKQLSNVKYLGWLDKEAMSEVFAKTSILIRITEHDGLPGMVLEMLARGRWVIHSNPITGAKLATTLDQARTVLADCLQQTDLNHAGIEYVKNAYAPDKLRRKLNELYKCIVSK